MTLIERYPPNPFKATYIFNEIVLFLFGRLLPIDHAKVQLLFLNTIYLLQTLLYCIQYENTIKCDL